MVTVLAGPLCGTELRRWPRGGWIWVAPDGRASRRPITGRWLYRFAGGCWIYAGHSHRLCSGCGALHQATDGQCTFCGGALAMPD